jgi:hypothetical protein
MKLQPTRPTAGPQQRNDAASRESQSPIMSKIHNPYFILVLPSTTAGLIWFDWP